MNPTKLRSAACLLTTLFLIMGCGSTKEFNTQNGFMPENGFSAGELEQLREQLVDYGDLDETPQVEGGMASIFMGLRYPEEARRAEAGGACGHRFYR